MPVTDSSLELSFPTPVFPVRRFSVDEYHRMIESGVLTEDDRVELLEGWIVPKMVRRPRHDATIAIIESALRQLVPAGCCLRIQSAITTADSEPEPDLALVKGEARDHLHRHPSGDEVLLVIEVSDSTLERDREKRRIYARAGIENYWIVNLVDGQIEVYRDPISGDVNARYDSATVVRRDQKLDVEIGDELTVMLDAAELLP